MKIALLVVCLMLDILTQNVYAVKEKGVSRPADITEAEESNNNKSNYLEDSSEDLSDSLVNKNARPKPVILKKKMEPLSQKQNAIRKRKMPKTHKTNRQVLEQISYSNSMEKDNQKRLKRKFAKKTQNTTERITNDMETESGELSDSRDGSSETVDIRREMKSNSGKRKSQNEESTDTEFKGSVEEEETIEEDIPLNRRSKTEKQKFGDLYRYGNEPLKNMLFWLAINTRNPTVRSTIKASKSAVDKYVKHTVDKASTQAGLRYTDYSSVRIDKDKILMYCGGQMFVYNTLKDSKICYNGQVHEVSLI